MSKFSRSHIKGARYTDPDIKGITTGLSAESIDDYRSIDACKPIAGRINILCKTRPVADNYQLK